MPLCAALSSPSAAATAGLAEVRSRGDLKASALTARGTRVPEALGRSCGMPSRAARLPARSATSALELSSFARKLPSSTSSRVTSYLLATPSSPRLATMSRNLRKSSLVCASSTAFSCAASKATNAVPASADSELAPAATRARAASISRSAFSMRAGRWPAMSRGMSTLACSWREPSNSVAGCPPLGLKRP